MKRFVHYFDRIVIREVVQLPEWVRPFMEFMTLLGQPPITMGFACGVVGYGLARDNSVLIAGGAVAVGTFVISSLMKLYLRRARPDNEYVRSMIIHTYSFPSGHAAGSLVCFGLGVFVISLVWPVFVVPAAAAVLFICFFIGISRIYLGAHYPSDVVGGWIVGALGLLLIFIPRIQL